VDLTFQWRYAAAVHAEVFASRPPSHTPLSYVCCIGDVRRLEQLLQRAPAVASHSSATVALAEAASCDHADCCR
jgi:hypothetical protein